MTRRLSWLAAVALMLAALVYINNTSRLVTLAVSRPILLAHRGLAQTFRREDLKNDTCTATRIHPPEHPYLENTIASMQAAFRAGADVVEFDVHPTSDGAFAVFHDWTLGCRTDGRGVTREHTLAQLKALDIGYGYTADGGATFPFRGKGAGLMPSLDEVLETFPDRRFLINVKSNDPREGDLLADRLARLPPERRARLMVYGGDRPIDVLRRRLPGLPAMSPASLKTCAIRYLALGWSGYVPAACRNTLVLLPADITPFAWGWPHRLVDRLRRAGTELFVAGAYDGEAGSNGIDAEAQLLALPVGYTGGIWTNRIDRIAPLTAR
ncbi:MAG: glycerophosphodiester phosphodiesterase [Hyphomicrobiaceae bacterium]|nr:MAG: glycerophosphodiester phosphodiesterase [Hyphomicrobiaceae bacterium]